MTNLLQEQARVHSDDLSDAAWLHDQGEYHHIRCAKGEDLHGLVSAALAYVSGALRFHGGGVAAYAKRHGVDLAAVWAQGAGSRRSKLAELLDAEASWYFHLDTAAGRLAAHEIQRIADAAEELGSATVEDFLIDEAAMHMALCDEIGGDL